MIVTIQEHDKGNPWISSLEFIKYDTYTAMCNIVCKRDLPDSVTIDDNGIEHGNRIIKIDSVSVTNHLFEIDIKQIILATITFIPETALDKHLVLYNNWDREYHGNKVASFAIIPPVSSPQAKTVETYIYTNHK